MCGHFWHCDTARGRDQELINYRDVHNYPRIRAKCQHLLSDHSRISRYNHERRERPTRAAPVPSNVSCVKTFAFTYSF